MIQQLNLLKCEQNIIPTLHQFVTGEGQYIQQLYTTGIVIVLGDYILS